jgi:endo-1,4-beta-xylanase
MRSWLIMLGGLLIAMASPAAETMALKTAFKDDFLIGAALNPAQFGEANPVQAKLVKAQFNSITPENVMKWEHIHPRPGEYDFSQTDRFVDFGLTNGMFIVGHTLVWHAQTPDWVFQNPNGKPVTREILLKRMRDHIFTVVGRYRGKVKGWDVVNEAIEDDGSLRKSPWQKIIGDDFIEQAFQFAHEADPDAELYYNDYGLESPEKRAGALALVKKLQAKGIRISGVGVQGHYQLAPDSPTAEEFSRTISDIARLGVKVMITELDVDVLPSVWKALSADVSLRKKGGSEFNPYTNALPAAVQQQLAARYAELFGVMLKHRDVVTRVTFWGVTDGDSWLNDWPIEGRTSYPLLFDREGKAKAAFYSVLALGQKSRHSQTGSAASHALEQAANSNLRTISK